MPPRTRRRAGSSRRQEPLQHVVVVAVQLDRVSACFGRECRRLPVLRDQPRDLVEAKPVRIAWSRRPEERL